MIMVKYLKHMALSNSATHKKKKTINTRGWCLCFGRQTRFRRASNFGKLFSLGVLHLPSKACATTTKTMTTMCNHGTSVACRSKAIGRPGDKSRNGRQLLSSLDRTNAVYISFEHGTKNLVVPHKRDGWKMIANVVNRRREWRTKEEQ